MDLLGCTGKYDVTVPKDGVPIYNFKPKSAVDKAMGAVMGAMHKAGL
jgi:hypothetical protein